MLVVGIAPEKVAEEVGPDFLLGEGEITTFVHLAYTSFTPWRTTLQSMKFAGTTGEAGVCSLQACMVWQSLWSFAEDLDLQLTWCIRLYELMQRRVAVRSLDPRGINVQAMPGRLGELVLVWTPRHDRVPRRPAILAFVDKLDEAPDPEHVAGGGGGEEEEQQAEDNGSDESDADVGEEVEGAPDPGEDDALGGLDVPAGGDDAPPEVPLGADRPARARALLDVQLGAHGRIAYYEYPVSGRKIFQATCGNKAHKGCQKTRSAKEDAAKPAQGRPLGFLVAWLLQSDDWETKGGHFLVDVAQPGLAPNQDARSVARAIAHIDFVGFADLEEKERDPRDGEDVEPELCP